MRHAIYTLATLAALAVVSFVGPAHAVQDAMPPSTWKAESPQTHIERGLTLMVKGDFEQAFKVLFGKGHTKEVLEKLKFEIYRLAKKNGNPYAYERILQHKAGTTLMKFRYLLLFDSQPMMFDFIYYKRKNGWALRNIHYSLDVRKAFDR